MTSVLLRAALPRAEPHASRRLASLVRHLAAAASPPAHPPPMSGASASGAAAAAATHRSPSAVHLTALNNVLNARDLAEASPVLRPGRLFRSGSPARASQEDVMLLRQRLRVQQMIDFRSSDELKEDTAWSLMLSNGVVKTYDASGNVAEVRRSVVGRPHQLQHRP